MSAARPGIPLFRKPAAGCSCVRREQRPRDASYTPASICSLSFLPVQDEGEAHEDGCLIPLERPVATGGLTAWTVLLVGPAAPHLKKVLAVPPKYHQTRDH